MNILMRKIDLQKDLSEIYEMMAAADQYLFSTHIRFKSQNDFFYWLSNRLKKEFQDFYIFQVATEEREIVGMAYDYDFSLLHGRCKLCVYIKPQYRNVGVGGIASLLFISRLFMEYPLRKVYSTIYEYNVQSLDSNLKAGFIEEGRIGEYRYYNGKYHDLVVLSMTRESFADKYNRIIGEKLCYV